MDLNELRGGIDDIDRQMVELFCRRMALSAQVAKYKQAHGLPIFVPQREQEILSSLSQKAGPELAPYVRSLYETIFSLSRQLQEEG